MSDLSKVPTVEDQVVQQKEINQRINSSSQELRDKIDTLQKQLEAALGYADHKNNCATTWAYYPKPCDCGFTKILEVTK